MAADGVMHGRVVRFNQLKGYGFIALDSGGDDVFLHVNDVLTDKHLIHAGAIVEFTLEQGERGLKASNVRLVQPAYSPAMMPGFPAMPGYPMPGPSGYPMPKPGPVSGPNGTLAEPRATGDGADTWSDEDGDDLVDVVPRREFLNQVTELLLTVEPSLTGPQIRVVREQLTMMCSRFGWVE